MNTKKIPSQCDEIKEFLDSGGILTRVNAAGMLFIFELSARIGEIESSGYPIKKKNIQYKSWRSGRMIKLTEYSKG